MQKRWLLILGGLSVLAGAAVVWPRPPVATSLEARGRAAPAPRFAPVDVSSHSAPGLVLSGRVLDAGGHPVPGAEVLLAASSQANLLSESCGDCGQPLLSCPARESALRVQEMLRQQQGALAPALSTHADGEGRFRFEHLAGVSFTVWASAPGLGTGLRERAAPGEPTELVLPALRSLRGVVRDEEGRPVAGARVHAVSRRLALPTEAMADRQGAFILSGLGEGPFYVLAEAPGWLPGASPLVDAGPEPVSLVLTAPRTLEVSVTYGGQPVEATVLLKGDHLLREQVARGGLARFEGLFPDSLVVSASSGSLAAPARSLTLEQPTSRLSLELEAAGRVSVTVVDDAGQPVPRPKVALVTPFNEVVIEREAQTGELVGLGPVSPGDYVVRASAEGFSPVELPVSVKKAGDSAVEVVMAQGTRLSGRVLDEYGRPVPGVGVTISPIQETVYTGEDGRFVSAVPNRGLYVLEAHHSDWGGARVEVTAPASGVEMRLEPRAGVVVTVEADGRPVEGAGVVIWADRTSSFHSDRSSGADGKVVMRGIPPGTWSVFAEHPRYLPSERQQITLAEGEPARLVVSLRQGAAVTGQVVDEQGRPIPGVGLTALPEGGGTATSDASGHFEIKPLWPDRPYRLEARHPRYELKDRRMITAGGEPLTLVMQEKVLVRGRVVDADGAPMRHFEVDTERQSPTDGRFEVYLPLHGDGSMIVISAPGYEPAMVDIPGSGDVGDVVLARSPQVTGVVRDERGAPVADALVSCSICDVSTVSGSQGEFSVARSAGDTPFSVTVRKGSMGGTREVPGGSSDPVEVVLHSTVRLSGRVYLPDGSPAAGQEMEAFDADSAEVVSFVTSADGSYTTDVPPGSYRIPLIPGEGDPGVPIEFVRVEGQQMLLDLGPAPGTGSLTVKVAPEPGYALWVVPGALSQVGNPPSELLNLPLGRMVFQPEEGAVTVRGLPPGRYTVVWGINHAQTPGGPMVRTVDVAGPTELSMLP